MNKIMLVGRLVRDPEVRSTSTGSSTANFTVAVSRNFKNKDGNYDADFLPCVAFRNSADFVSKYFKKGSLIGIEGRVQTRNYDAQDGTKRYTTEIVVDNFEFLGSRNDGGSANQNYSAPASNNSTAYSPEAPVAPSAVETTDISEDPYKDFGDEFTLSSDDLPF